MRALFLATYPRTAAATRFRFVQFFPFLQERGIDCTLSTFLSDDAFADLYRPERRVRTVLRGLGRGATRLGEAARARDYDVVIVQRNAMLYGPPLMEKLIAQVMRRPLVYDYDDAIWLQDHNPTWGVLARIARWPGRTASLIRMARHVVACNTYTREYALRFRKAEDVSVIPTVVDPAVYRPDPQPRPDGVPVVGWIGTHSTAKYLEDLRPAIEAAGARARFRLRIVGAGRPFTFRGVEVENKRWSLENEVMDYQGLDVGLYPVRDDEWGHGKTGFKPVVYMSCGAACVASPVGGVTEFIRHGSNGLFAATTSEWTEHIVRLVEDASFRQRLGTAGRETVLARYSVGVHAPTLASIIDSAARS